MSKLLLYNGIKWIEIAKNGEDGKDANEERIIDEVIKKIPKPKDGIDGVDGKDGKSVTVKEVLESLKKLKNIFEISHIKGLEQHLAVSRQKMYGVGPSGALTGVSHDTTISGDGTPEKPLKVVGGGGAPTRETPVGDINGVNTTFTITSATTHLIYHNGALLEEGAGNDYTISGTVLTMLWAPESGKLSHVYWA